MCLCLASLLPAPSSRAQSERLYLTQSASGGFIAPDVARKKGFFEAEGLNVETVVVPAANISIAGMLAKNIDYTILLGALARAALQGAPVRLVLLIMDRPTYDLVGRPEIKSLEELRGKTVGVSTIGAGSEVITRMILMRAGLIPDRDVRLLPLASAMGRMTALEKGLVAAALINPPFTFALEKQGYRILVKAADLPPFPYMGLGTTVDRIRERPDEVKLIIKALLRANLFIRKEKAQSVAMIMESARLDRETAERYYDSTWPLFSRNGEFEAAGMNLIVDLARKDLGIKDEVSLSQIADFAPLKAAQKELGIR